MGEWKNVRLGDVADVNWGDTSTTKASYVSHGFPAYSATGPDGLLSYSDYDRTGVVLSAIGANCGKTWLAKGKWSCIKNTIRFWSTSADVDTEFLFWATSDPQTWPQRGSAQAFISQGDARNVNVSIPPLPIQRRIAHILGTLDDKIELNRRMNRTLEKMAVVIFKSWFIDFDPVHAKAEGRDTGLPAEIADLFPDSFDESEHGRIPMGWTVGTLGEHALNFDSKRVPVSGAERAKRRGPYPYHGAAAVMDYVNDYLFDGVFLLVGEDGSVVRTNGIAVTQYVWGKIWVNNHAHVLQGKGAVSTEQLYLYFSFEPVAPYVTGAVQPKLSQGRMNQMPFVYPGEDICGAFATTIRPLFARLRANADQIKTLSIIRDTLLPKLLSGEIDVPDVEQTAGRSA